MNSDFELSSHALDMLKERKILQEWLWETLNNPDWTSIEEDKNMHYFKSISAYNNRVLHVVVNQDIVPKIIVTVFFDRRMRKQL
ncbi:MAG: DUF4258 domain-containing protein [bacterium]